MFTLLSLRSVSELLSQSFLTAYSKRSSASEPVTGYARVSSFLLSIQAFAFASPSLCVISNLLIHSRSFIDWSLLLTLWQCISTLSPLFSLIIATIHNSKYWRRRPPRTPVSASSSSSPSPPFSLFCFFSSSTSRSCCQT